MPFCRSVTLRTRWPPRRRRSRSFADAVVHHLLLTWLQLVLEVPLHQRQMRHARHVAVRVVNVIAALMAPTVVLLRRLLLFAGSIRLGSA